MHKQVLAAAKIAVSLRSDRNPENNHLMSGWNHASEAEKLNLEA
jgi:hypothetical protein